MTSTSPAIGVTVKVASSIGAEFSLTISNSASDFVQSGIRF